MKSEFIAVCAYLVLKPHNIEVDLLLVLLKLCVVNADAAVIAKMPRAKAVTYFELTQAGYFTLRIFLIISFPPTNLNK